MLQGLAHAAFSSASPALELLRELDEYPHALQVAASEAEVTDYEIGLGAMRKARGQWQFKFSERHSGLLRTWTWQIVDGFDAAEVYAELRQRLEQLEDAAVLFSCSGRDCGQGVQWANRVFRQRILYGRDDLQQYSVHDVGGRYRVLLYSSVRTADRQHLHAELLEISPTD